MNGRPVKKLHLSTNTRNELNRLAQNKDSPLSLRAQIILLKNLGHTQSSIAASLLCTQKSVSKWINRFEESGISGLSDLLGRGRKPNPKKNKTHKNKPLPSKPSVFVQPLADQSDPTESPAPSPKTSMRMIAESAGVSVMTVSRVLQSHPHVHPTTRQRVLSAIDQTDYRPDPQLKKLMIHLRQRKTLRLQGVICSLNARAWAQEAKIKSDGYFNALVSGARKKAEAMGFSWKSFSLETFLENPIRSSRILYNQGVEGILLPPAPLNRYENLPTEDAIWNRFSVVTATSVITAPPFRRVMPDYFQNMMLICQSLTRLGYQRIGLSLPTQLDEKVLHHFTGAFYAFHLAHHKDALRPFLFRSVDERNNLHHWFQQQKPDALIISSSTMAADYIKRLKLSENPSIGIAAVALLDNSSAGINECPDLIGTQAAEALAQMIVHYKKGIPQKPIITMVGGQWQEGPSAPPKLSTASTTRTNQPPTDIPLVETPQN